MKKMFFQDTSGCYFTLLRAGFVLSFLLTGLYYEWGCALASIYFMGLLFWKSGKTQITFHVNDASLAVCAVWLFYSFSCLWAVDGGLAVWGAVRYMPLPLFGLCLMQLSAEQRMLLLEDIPWIGSGMTIATFLLQFVSLFTSSFSVNGRLAGFFQYPNTFACFLLLGIELLLTNGRVPRYPWLRWVCGVVLFFGLIQAGSRTIFLFAVPSILVCLITRRGRKNLLFALCTIVGAALVSAAVWWTGTLSGAGRILAISGSASTLLGRLLYWKDALPIIAGHPFGLGYLGYYITQGSFQTGVYSVRWVHNDLLQLLLDVGWIPAVLAVIAVFKGIFSVRSTARQRIVFLTLLAHCMMDFDLEFISMYFVLLLCLDWEDMKRYRLHMPFVPAAALASVLGIGGIWIGITSSLTYANLHTVAAAIYPWNTLSNMALLTMEEDVDSLEALADRILAQDKSIALAWDAKAQAAYAAGKFDTVITAKREAISLARYSLEEYVDYFEKLAAGVALYLEAGDTKSADICLEEIASIQVLLDNVTAQTDALAWRLADTPQLEMPEAYQQYLLKMGFDGG